MIDFKKAADQVIAQQKAREYPQPLPMKIGIPNEGFLNGPSPSIPNESIGNTEPAPIWRCVVCGEVHPAEDAKAMLVLRSSSKTWLKWEICLACAPGMGKKINAIANVVEGNNGPTS